MLQKEINEIDEERKKESAQLTNLNKKYLDQKRAINEERQSRNMLIRDLTKAKALLEKEEEEIKLVEIDLMFLKKKKESIVKERNALAHQTDLAKLERNHYVWRFFLFHSFMSYLSTPFPYFFIDGFNSRSRSSISRISRKNKNSRK